MSNYQANLYPLNAANPTVQYADSQRKSIAVCFSGGGSRALTCAWGQLIGLNSLKDNKGQPLLDQVRYISSVSGGTWASVLYTFRPATFTDDEFLGNCYLPSALYYNQDVANGLNVSKMPAHALGKIPQNFANLFELNPLKNIIAKFIIMTIITNTPLSESAKWLWMHIVGKNVLADFDLYTFKSSLFNGKEPPWNYQDAKFFSLSASYAEQHIFNKDQAPAKDQFVYARTDAQGKPSTPMLIMNTNVVGKDSPNAAMSAPLQIPLQVSAVSAAIYGKNPCVDDTIGGGGVEPFAFSANLLSGSNSQTVTVNATRAYTLADIASCSSAFYASVLVDPLKAMIATLLNKDDAHLSSQLSQFMLHIEESLLQTVRNKLANMQGELQSLSKDNIVPQYNYWSVVQASEGVANNQQTQFTDAGDLENTGIAGLLAQVQGTIDNIIAFVNSSEVVEEKNSQIIVATQLSHLFGMAYDAEHNEFANYLDGGINPFTQQIDPMGFLQIFDNSQNQFNALRQGLYAANGSGAKTDAAFYLQTLNIIKNTLLGINETRSINILWVQNAQVNHWQNQITDTTLKEKITTGQQQGGKIEFANFPYYNTFHKIHQTEAETNTLAQMWAWCVSHSDSPLSAAIVKMFASA